VQLNATTLKKHTGISIERDMTQHCLYYHSRDRAFKWLIMPIKSISGFTNTGGNDKIPYPMAYKSIKDWPEDERPRERLLTKGADIMSDAQLIAIILRTGGHGKSAMDMAMELIEKFGSLKKIEQASLSEICSLKGIGRAKAAQLRASLELGKRLLDDTGGKGPAFSAGKDVYAYFRPRLSGLKKEVFHCAMLDVKNRLIRDSRISEGTLTSSLIHPREAFREAIKESAASVIFVHNHPSGDPQPSREDILITGKLESAGETVGIRVVDHIIIGDSEYTSMLEKGYLKGK
jgi:DNA repair protein RadC